MRRVRPSARTSALEATKAGLRLVKPELEPLPPLVFEGIVGALVDALLREWRRENEALVESPPGTDHDADEEREPAA
jgi:hypothetical protein